MSVVIIDADPIIYAAGFAAQSSTYHYVWEQDGKMHQRFWGDGLEALRYFRENKDATVLEKEVHIETKDVAFARQAAKTQLSSIVRACSQELGVAEPQVEIYLSGPGNYRDRIATIAPYKADRPPPPVHYQALRDYLTNRWGAVVISGMEADDKVSIRCRELAADAVPFVLATIDKDLDQVPGLHYGYKDHVFYDVDEDYAKQYFWQQVLSGDSTDNIPGCPKVGAVKAKKIIDNMVGDGFDDQAIWAGIVGTYDFSVARYPDKFPPGMTGAQAALETARLVFMQEYEGQLWNPPGVPHGEVSELAPDQ